LSPATQHSSTKINSNDDIPKTHSTNNIPEPNTLTSFHFTSKGDFDRRDSAEDFRGSSNHGVKV
jgi:hypothetical protein